MVYEALKNFSTSDINLFFLSNLDVTEADELLSNLNKDTTLFILVSKKALKLQKLSKMQER